MKFNMKEWVRDCIDAEVKKPMPILSFPGVQLTGHTVDEMVRSGHLQAECMKAIADRFDTMAAFSLMDLSVEAEAFGSPVHYSGDEVPTVTDALIHDEDEAEALQVPEVGAGRTGECVKGIAEAVELIQDRPVLAGIIGPFSLAGRLLDMTEIMILSYEDPELVETVLEKATKFLIKYAEAFKMAGANGIAIAEPAAGLLSPGLIQEFSTPYVKKIRESLEDEEFLVLYHNCGSVIPLMDSLKEIGALAYSIGNAVDIENVLKAFPQNCIVTGNIDPAGTLRNGTPEKVYDETKAILERCAAYSNFVIGSGCDIPPMTPLENIQAMFDAVSDFYRSK
ncbi:MAG TPA: uroporphyrinogen decarboxylase family protein [Candidatus Mediterraneibacter norfolkensis]|nr:uroporphyrinogen decarboxylase family protein [Candidatus Mediterraneibacter norfolkensis]